MVRLLLVFCLLVLLLIFLYVIGKPCDEKGDFLPPGIPPPARDDPQPNDWTPFRSRIEFKTAEFLFKKEQVSAGCIDELFELWAASNIALGGTSPFKNARDMYKTIDQATLGGVPWESFKLRYQDEVDPEQSPSWMTAEHTVWYRDPDQVIKNLLANPDFAGDMDFSPQRDYDVNGQRQYHNFMTGDWSWEQAVSVSHFAILTNAHFVVRIFLRLTQLIMVPYLSPSFWAVIRQRSLS